RKLNALLAATLRKLASLSTLARVGIERSALLVDDIFEFDIILLCHQSHAASEPVASRRGGLHAQGRHQRPCIFQRDGGLAAPSQMINVAASHIEETVCG